MRQTGLSSLKYQLKKQLCIICGQRLDGTRNISITESYKMNSLKYKK